MSLMIFKSSNITKKKKENGKEKNAIKWRSNNRKSNVECIQSIFHPSKSWSIGLERIDMCSHSGMTDFSNIIKALIITVSSRLFSIIVYRSVEKVGSIKHFFSFSIEHVHQQVYSKKKTKYPIKYKQISLFFSLFNSLSLCLGFVNLTKKEIPSILSNISFLE